MNGWRPWLLTAAVSASLAACRPHDGELGERVPVEASLLGVWEDDSGSRLTLDALDDSTYVVESAGADERTAVTLGQLAVPGAEPLEILNLGNDPTRLLPLLLERPAPGVIRTRTITAEALDKDAWNHPETGELAAFIVEHRDDRDFGGDWRTWRLADPVPGVWRGVNPWVGGQQPSDEPRGAAAGGESVVWSGVNPWVGGQPLPPEPGPAPAQPRQDAVWQGVNPWVTDAGSSQ